MKQGCIDRHTADVEPLNDRDIEYEKNLGQNHAAVSLNLILRDVVYT